MTTIERARLLCIEAAALRTRYAVTLFALLDARRQTQELRESRHRRAAGLPHRADPA